MLHAPHLFPPQASCQASICRVGAEPHARHASLGHAPTTLIMLWSADVVVMNGGLLVAAWQPLQLGSARELVVMEVLDTWHMARFRSSLDCRQTAGKAGSIR
jgi:hypothetical protein